MPRYLVTSEAVSNRTTRLPRGHGDRNVHIVTAPTLTAAVAELDPWALRVTSAEELVTPVVYADEQIADALTCGDSTVLDLAEHEYTVRALAEDAELLIGAVRDVVSALAEDLVPQLDISVLANEPDPPYGMVEMYDPAVQQYRSVGRELAELLPTTGTPACGMAVLEGIARAVLEAAGPLH